MRLRPRGWRRTVPRQGSPTGRLQLKKDIKVKVLTGDLEEKTATSKILFSLCTFEILLAVNSVFTSEDYSH